MTSFHPCAARPVSDLYSPKSRHAAYPVWSCWWRSWLGTGISGVLFGVIAGPIGMIVGGVIAFPVGFAVTLASFLTAYAFGQDRLTLLRAMLVAGLSGFVSGVASAALLTSGRVGWPNLIAGIVGAAGSMIGCAWQSWTRSRRRRRDVLHCFDEPPEVPTQDREELRHSCGSARTSDSERKS